MRVLKPVRLLLCSLSLGVIFISSDAAAPGGSSGAPATASLPPSTAGRGPVWAYGEEVHGDPWFETRGDTLYYQGKYPYYPRRPNWAALAAYRAANPDRPETEAEKAAWRVWSLAGAATKTARSEEEWFRLFTGVLDQHRDIVTKYEINGDAIMAWFAEVAAPMGTSAPRPGHYPPSAQPRRQYRDRATVRKDEEKRFWSSYRHGDWFCFGDRYTAVVPPTGHPEMVAAIDSLDALVASGLKGDALRSEIISLHLDHELEPEEFLRDLLDQAER